MIVGRSDTDTLIIGLCEADIAIMRKGLTKTKHGGPEYGFREMVIFMGKNDQEMLKMLKLSPNHKRRDDIDAGLG